MATCCAVFSAAGAEGPEVFVRRKEIAGSLNSAKYKNPQVDKLLVDGRQNMDPARRQQIYSELQKIILVDAPRVYQSHSLDMAAYSQNVENFSLHPDGCGIPQGHRQKIISQFMGTGPDRWYNPASAPYFCLSGSRQQCSAWPGEAIFLFTIKCYRILDILWRS